METFHTDFSNFSDLQNSTNFVFPDFNITTSNHTEQLSQSLLTPGPVFMKMYLSFRVLWSILSFIGNLMTIIMVAKFEVLQTNTNFLLCSLGVADLVGGLLAPLEMVHLAHRNGPLYVPICLIEKVNLHFVLPRGGDSISFYPGCVGWGLGYAPILAYGFDRN